MSTKIVDKSHLSQVVPLTPLYTPEQVYAIEKKWFEAGNLSFGLMQQAAWQMAHWIATQSTKQTAVASNHPLNVWVWVGSGNNGGDGWLVASYLSQLGATVQVIEVGQSSTKDAKSAQKIAKQHNITVFNFDDETAYQQLLQNADVFVDALFGIGLNRAPKQDYAKAIHLMNTIKQSHNVVVCSVDVPSGLVAATGAVFDGCAVNADVTLCLVARKLGLHIKDASDYTGLVVDFPLIPSVLESKASAWLQHTPNQIATRQNNTHKGSFGHVLIIGGNQVAGSQGMGGAAILAASSAFAVGVGKLTVACHSAFHASLITSLHNAMSIDIEDTNGVSELIKACDTLAIGMGLGRDDQSLSLFETYLRAALEAQIDILIDADGLYHLATLANQKSALVQQLRQYASFHQVWYTPHSGEAARLLNDEVKDIESDRLAAIHALHDRYQGSWLLKGAGSIVIEDCLLEDQNDEQDGCESLSSEQKTFICAAGNAGMATAGMGDVLSGLAAGLLAQSALPIKIRRLQQAVMIHAVAGDRLAKDKGEWALQAGDMPKAIGDVMKELTLD